MNSQLIPGVLAILWLFSLWALLIHLCFATHRLVRLLGEIRDICSVSRDTVLWLQSFEPVPDAENPGMWIYRSVIPDGWATPSPDAVAEVMASIPRMVEERREGSGC